VSNVSIRLGSQSVARRLAERLAASGFTAVVAVGTSEVEVDLPAQLPRLTELLSLVEEALVTRDDGQAVIRLDGRSYLVQCRAAG
jgi:NAD(P)-dependent dehydrogenase (short-subunit alcohol dehydrogenase family)